VFSKNYSLVIGGACEDKHENPKNQFHQRFLEVSKAYKDKYWETTIFYDSDSWPQPKVDGVQGYTSDPDVIENYINELSSGLVEGDQIKFDIITHGSPASLCIREKDEVKCDYNPRHHQICLGENQLISLEEFNKRFIEKVTKKGVKISINDGSCFGGNAVSVFPKDNICVTSQTSSSRVGHTFYGALRANLLSHQNYRTKPFEFSIYTFNGVNSLDLNGDKKISESEIFLTSKYLYMTKKTDQFFFEWKGKKISNQQSRLLPFANFCPKTSVKTDKILDFLSGHEFEYDFGYSKGSVEKMDLPFECNYERVYLGFNNLLTDIGNIYNQQLFEESLASLQNIETTTISDLIFKKSAILANLQLFKEIKNKYDLLANKINDLQKLNPNSRDVTIGLDDLRNLEIESDIVKSKIYSDLAPFEYLSCDIERRTSEKNPCDDIYL